MSNLEHALKWAALGPVFPVWPPESGLCGCKRADCPSPAKHPMSVDGGPLRGFHDGTTDLDRIAEWWTRWPDANIGLACGHLVDVIDIDGPQGEQAYEKLCANLGGQPAVLAEVTTGRGRHLYVQPPGKPNLTGKAPSPYLGIDVRGLGGYVLAPPSRHVNGSAYRMTGGARDGISWDTTHAELTRHKTVTQPREPLPVPARGSDITDAWGQSVIDRLTLTVLGAEQGNRNDTLNNAAFQLGMAWAGRSVVEPDGMAELADAAEQVGLTDREIGQILPRACYDGMSKGQPIVKPEGYTEGDVYYMDMPETRRSPPPAPAVEVNIDYDSFWGARPELAHIHATARARMCSPWAVLGVTLCRVVALVPPRIVLPAIVGSEASLNLFVALTGPSGAGKGAAEGAARAAFITDHVEEAGAGSGEGIAHLYAHREKGTVMRDRDSVLFSVPEVDNLQALGARQGATLMPQLRSAWSGERLGFSYSDPAKRLPIDAHSYRLGLVLGAQPLRCRPLLDDADGGTPQRFLWMPTVDNDAPDETPPCPEPLPWEYSGKNSPWTVLGLSPLKVPAIAVDTIRQARLDNLRGNTDAMDGHALLCRLKTAAALCFLNGRHSISEQDWELAGIVMHVSNATRESVVKVLREQAALAHAAKAKAEGDRAVVVEETLAEHRLGRMRKKLVVTLQKMGGRVARSELRRAISSRDRPHIDEALASLAHDGVVVCTDDGGSAFVTLGKV